MSVSFLRWNAADFAAMGPYSSPLNQGYPYLTLEWNSENAGKYGVGVMQSMSPKGAKSELNYAYLSPYQNILQWLLQNDPDISTMAWVNDGGQYNPNSQGDVTLPQLLSFMLAPEKAASGAPAQPFPNGSGNFSLERVWCINPTLTRYLPMVDQMCSSSGNTFLGCYTVLPPYGFVNTGVYCAGNNSGSKTYLYPGSQLQFLLKDPRFAQPAANGYIPKDSYQNHAVWGYNPFVVAVTQSVMGSSTPQTFNYQYTPLAGVMTWPGWSWTQYSMNDYPNDFPWAINQQLLRIFPNGPRNTFSNLVLERFLWSGSSSCQSGGGNVQIYAGNPRQHPCILVVLSGSQVFPVIAYWSLYNILACCTGQLQFSDYIWNFAGYELPVGVTPSTTNLNQALCLAGYEGSYQYLPGTDCDLATSAYCDPSQKEFTQPTCSCFNTDAMLASVGLSPDPSDPSEAQLAATLTANITCVDSECIDAGSFKLSTFPGVQPNGKPCPDLQNCIISGTTTDGGDIGKLENNCTSNTSAGTSISSLTAAQWIMIAAAIFFVVIVFVLLIERHNRKKLTRQLKKSQQEQQDKDTEQAKSK